MNWWCKAKSLLCPGVPQRRIYSLCLWSQFNYLQWCYWFKPQGQLPVAVDRNPLRVMASDIAEIAHDPLHCSTSWAPLAQYKSVQPLPGIEPATIRIRGNSLAYCWLNISDSSNVKQYIFMNILRSIVSTQSYAYNTRTHSHTHICIYYM